jgi:ATP-dependent helicase/nuclease subunit A
MAEQLGFDFSLASAPTAPAAPGAPAPAPPDDAARRRIAVDLDATLFVEAGAGAGKTTALVGRIAGLVAAGVAIESIAAITFTDKAATELRHRLRHELQARADDPRFAAALTGVDHAAIGTLHSFARRILNEFPIEAGLPPGFAVLDELESNLAFDERWSDFVDALLADPDPSGGPLAGGAELAQLCDFDGFGIDRGLRRVADDFRANWDLVVERVCLDEPAALVLDVDAVVVAGRALAAVTAPDGDRQAEQLAEIAIAVERVAAAHDLRGRLVGLGELARLAERSARAGNRRFWAATSSEADLDALRDAQRDLAALAAAAVDRALAYRRDLLGALLGRFTLAAADERAAAGTLEFHDLLVLARRLLAGHPEARASLHDRYRRLLLDEFQDTDPIQLEIAVRLAAAPDDPAQQSDWQQLHPLPGRLFVVGDPKQSIYRFRRADIAQYLRAADQVGADTEVLSANFRSTSAVISWVNHVFANAIREEAGVQPAYQPLTVCRRGPASHGTVGVIGATPHADLEGSGAADELRERESADVAATVATALHDGWLVTDADAGGLRPCRPGDITILLPTRTSLPALERALRSLDLPARAENSSVVYTTAEIRRLMLALRAADDPTDQLALVETLRSELYGCSDVELYEWKVAGGRWSIWADPPEGLTGHGVADAVIHLRSLARRLAWMPPAEVLAALVDERRVLDAALARPDGRDVWQRIRYVIEQARAWSDAGGRGMRRYLRWVRLQAAEGRMADTILPEHDHDAVRVMTVHAAKGLEFPITIVAGLTTLPRRLNTVGVVWPAATWSLNGTAGGEVYDAFVPIDEQMSDAERRRLLYVACTRAVDHLVVSAHRLASRRDADPAKQTSAELLMSCGATAPDAGATVLAPRPHHHVRSVSPPFELPWADPVAWSGELARALTVGRRRTVTSATRLAVTTPTAAGAAGGDGGGAAAVEPGLAKDPVDLDLPPWQRGRYGTAVGRAVHGVLQFADLRTGGGIDDLARAQCAAEGIIGLDRRVAALARSALAAPVVADAAQRQHWRELFVAAPIGEQVVEGYVDLLVRTPAGLTIVDYKTDRWPTGDDRALPLDRYRRQLAAYAVAIEAILGEPVVAGVLVHCRPDGPAAEVVLEGWADAVGALRAGLTAATA